MPCVCVVGTMRRWHTAGCGRGGQQRAQEDEGRDVARRHGLAETGTEDQSLLRASSTQSLSPQLLYTPSAEEWGKREREREREKEREMQGIAEGGRYRKR